MPQRMRQPAPFGQEAHRTCLVGHGAAAAEGSKSCSGAAAPQRRAGGTTWSSPPPPPPVMGGAPPRQGRCGPRLLPTPGEERVLCSPRRYCRSANWTKERPPSVSIAAHADDDGSARRWASGAGGKTAAYRAALDPAAPPQRTQSSATPPPFPSAAPAEVPRCSHRRRRPPGAARPHAEGVVAPALPVRLMGSVFCGACAAVVASRSVRREYLPLSASPGPPTTTGADKDARRERPQDCRISLERPLLHRRCTVAPLLRLRSCRSATTSEQRTPHATLVVQ